MYSDQLKTSFAFYAAYHRNKVNKIIHIITIPLISWTILIFLNYLPSYQNADFGSTFAITFAIFPVIVYLSIYILLDWRAGLLITPYIVAQYFLANIYRFNVPEAWISALIIFVLAWILQFMGHGIWEGRKPALLDSLSQAFIMAPLFVFMEMLFMCGWRKQFQREIDALSRQYDPIA